MALLSGLLPSHAGLAIWPWDRRTQLDLSDRIGRFEWIAGTAAASLLIPTFILVSVVNIST